MAGTLRVRHMSPMGPEVKPGLRDLMKKLYAFIVVGSFLAAGCGSVFGNKPSDRQGLPLSMMTYNIGDLESRSSYSYMEELVDLIRRQGAPDLLLLQEAPSAKAVESLAHRLEMTSHLFVPYRSNSRFGLAVLSRGELGAPQVLYFKASRVGRGALLTRMRFKGSEVTVGSVHMDHISSVERGSREILVSWRDALGLIGTELTEENVRSLCAAELMDWLGHLSFDRIILGGDFNTIPFSRMYRIMSSRFDDALWPSWDFFTGSYCKTSLPIQPRIDYIFYDGSLVCQDAFILKETIGDHYPVLAHFAL